ncbi:hypothetical protein [Micromonospora musae]|uniref:Uncharacterized protein n=1 Tax=Micromonospora musae TaxID=1894970 RepID=A0A3A9Y9Q6_9ACTN|nr:hypothetical protein [Micromonospora musae]RKN28326.1 hypothetical protein D7044_26065 [Micromonospora musae]
MSELYPPPRDSAPAMLAWLGHPVSVAALILLLVNDRLLKAEFAGPMTGKLSDVAGLVVAPPLIAVLFTLLAPRLPNRAAVGLGLGLAGVVFTVVKSHADAAAAASAAWSVVNGPSLVRADLTDLLALPALALAAFSWTRARRERVRRRTARLVRLLVLLPAATFAAAATSAVHYPDAVRVAVVDGRLVAEIGSGYGDYATDAGSWRVSDDDGGSWRDATEAEQGALRNRVSREGEPARQACSSANPSHCYRLVTGRLRVDESDDAGRTWRTAWEVTEQQRVVLIRQYEESGVGGPRVSGQELVVRDTTDGRHVVLVANGRDGFALRYSDGAWERIGFAGAEVGNHPFGGRAPTLGESSPASRGQDPLRVTLLLAGLAVLVLAVSGARAGKRAGTAHWLPITLGHLGALLVGMLLVVWLDTALLGAVAPLGLGPLLIGTAALALVPARAPNVPRRWALEVSLAAALTAAMAALPLVGWLYGRPVYVWTALLLAFLAGVPGLLLGWRTARLVGAPTLQADPPYPSVPVRPPT